MKVLLFTHKNDIDGMGNAVLSKIAFDEVDYVLCYTFDLINTVNNYYDEGILYNYDKVYITDLCLDLNTIEKISKDDKLKNKFYIFDHHKTYDTKEYKSYDFVNIEIKNELGLCSATSNFYNYLVNERLIDKNNLCIKEYVELTRLHDTWEWKNIYNNEKARELALLFDCLGTDTYIEFMFNKLISNSIFSFNDIETMLINNKKREIDNSIKEYLNNIYVREINGLKAAIIFIKYSDRNEIAEYLRENKYDADFTMMISLDKNVVCYRCINDNVCVREIAELFGGKGHDKAATNPIDEDMIENIINLITKIN